MKAKRSLLGDCLRITSGFPFEASKFNDQGNGMPVARIRDVVRGFSRTYYLGDYPKAAELSNGDLLIGMDGEFNIAPWHGGAALLNQRVCKITPIEGVSDAAYLKHALALVLKRIEAVTPFVTVKHLSDDLNESEIDLPSLADQRRIAAQLEQADRLRRTRRYTLELSDSFGTSTFLRLFANGANLPLRTVEELLALTPNAIRTGPFGSQLLHSEFTDSGVAVLGIDNAVNNCFEWSERRYISPKKYEQLKRYTVHPGDVIITLMGTCGRCSIVPDSIPTAINTKHLCCITLNKKRCLPEYLHAAFLHHPKVRHQLGISQKGAIMDGLSMEIIKNLRIPLPPIAQQHHFATLVTQHERLRATQRESLRQAEHLFQTLLHRAFSPT